MGYVLCTPKIYPPQFTILRSYFMDEYLISDGPSLPEKYHVLPRVSQRHFTSYSIFPENVNTFEFQNRFDDVCFQTERIFETETMYTILCIHISSHTDAVLCIN